MAEETNLERRRFCAGITLTVISAQLGMPTSATARNAGESSAAASMIPVQDRSPGLAQLPIEGKMPSLGGAGGWLNSPPLEETGFRGKVVLVSFWTYTCINWMRSLPYVRAWNEKYKDQGLMVIGVHTPEFSFEKNSANVRQAVDESGIEYPVAIDSDYVIWNAFKNGYWPALYFIDRHGYIRHHQFGEGNYEHSEVVIQQLLLDGAKRSGTDHQLVSVRPRGVERAADWDNLRSPETYLGYGRGSNFASPGGAVTNQLRFYAMPARLGANHWALAGEWTVGNEATLLNQAGGRVACRFHARDLHLVMGVRTGGTPVQFRVLLNGQPPGPAHGIDIDSSGRGTVAGQRLYQLIRQPGRITDQHFDIEFFDAGAEVFAFTFG
jgi:thiol-disulfide isomerase/thioredoxin